MTSAQRADRVQLIHEAAASHQPFDVLQSRMAVITQTALSEELSSCGIIPVCRRKAVGKAL
jgi:hypothetical protein